MSVDQQFNKLSDSIQQLLKQYRRLQKENDSLKNELQKSLDNQKAAREQIEELQQQVTLIKLANGETNEKDKKLFEKTINQYIKEIDKCISFLSQ